MLGVTWCTLETSIHYLYKWLSHRQQNVLDNSLHFTQKIIQYILIFGKIFVFNILHAQQLCDIFPLIINCHHLKNNVKIL